MPGRPRIQPAHDMERLAARHDATLKPALPILPMEIISRISRHCANDNQTLIALALVSRSFNAAASADLYAHVQLSGEHCSFLDRYALDWRSAIPEREKTALLDGLRVFARNSTSAVLPVIRIGRVQRALRMIRNMRSVATLTLGGGLADHVPKSALILDDFLVSMDMPSLFPRLERIRIRTSPRLVQSRSRAPYSAKREDSHSLGALLARSPLKHLCTSTALPLPQALTGVVFESITLHGTRPLLCHGASARRFAFAPPTRSDGTSRPHHAKHLTDLARLVLCKELRIDGDSDIKVVPEAYIIMAEAGVLGPGLWNDYDDSATSSTSPPIESRLRKMIARELDYARTNWEQARPGVMTNAVGADNGPLALEDLQRKVIVRNDSHVEARCGACGSKV